MQTVSLKGRQTVQEADRLTHRQIANRPRRHAERQIEADSPTTALHTLFLFLTHTTHTPFSGNYLKCLLFHNLKLYVVRLVKCTYNKQEMLNCTEIWGCACLREGVFLCVHGRGHACQLVCNANANACNWCILLLWRRARMASPPSAWKRNDVLLLTLLKLWTFQLVITHLVSASRSSMITYVADVGISNDTANASCPATSHVRRCVTVSCVMCHLFSGALL